MNMVYLHLYCLTLFYIGLVCAINTTNLGNDQDILDLKKDVSFLKNIVVNLKTSMQALQLDNEMTIAHMSATIKAQEHQIKEQQEKIDAISENNTSLNKVLLEVEETVNKNIGAYALIAQDIVSSFSTLRNAGHAEITDMNNNLTSIARQMQYTSRALLDAQKTLSALENTLNDDKMTIAFTVTTSSHLQNYNDKIIIYDKVFTNEGNGFNNGTGIFTCPKRGIYVFTWSTMSGSSSQDCYSYIYHNNIPLVKSYSYEAGTGSHEVASNTIVIPMDVGDLVWIKTQYGTYCYGYPFTGFSGWKI